MSKDSFLVSIITITFNSEGTIEDTLKSVLEQTHSNLEYIIVDGKSNDKTLEIVQKHEDEFNKRGIDIRIVSEEDKGIADAWNKGLALARGEVIGLLNSDDWYEREAVENAMKILNPKKNEISYGICKRVDGNKKVVDTMATNFMPNRVYLNFGFSHTTCFVTKKVYKTIGDFNINFKIAMDVDFLLRSVQKNVVFKRADNITFMRMGGVSTKFRKEALMEYQTALKNNGYNIILIGIFGLIKRILLFRNK